MYFPYLYGRQGECRALEDVASLLGSPQSIFPVLEPVVESATDIVRALDRLSSVKREVYLIVNPSRHKLQLPDAVDRWKASVSSYIANTALVRPTFEIRPATTASDLVSFLGTFAGRPLGVSIRSSHFPAVDIASATAGRDVLFFLHGSADASGYSSALGAAKCVEVKDRFSAAARNADYAGQEKFTSEHRVFRGESRIGFSDYALLPGVFNASGGPLGAAVIHMSFVNSSDDSVWVEHFVSDEVRQYFGSQPSKLMEAMKKLHDAKAAEPGKFYATPGMNDYMRQYAARTPTSPTYNKRQQISHHIDTIGTIL